MGYLNVIFIPQHNDNELLSMTYNSILVENSSLVCNVSMHLSLNINFYQVQLVVISQMTV